MISLYLDECIKLLYNYKDKLLKILNESQLNDNESKSKLEVDENKIYSQNTINLIDSEPRCHINEDNKILICKVSIILAMKRSIRVLYSLTKKDDNENIFIENDTTTEQTTINKNVVNKIYKKAIDNKSNLSILLRPLEIFITNDNLNIDQIYEIIEMIEELNEE